MARKHRRKRRTRRRKSSHNKINSVIIRGPSAFPDRVYVRLKYTNSLAISISALNFLEFSGNGVNQPDDQATAERPRGFNEWMAIYARYKCHKSSISVQILNLDALTLDAVVVPSVLAPTGVIDTEDVREQPYARSRRLTGASGSISGVTIFNSMKTKTMYGTRFIDREFTGAISTKPSQQWNWRIYTQNLTNDVGTTNLDVSVSITYFIELSQRHFIQRSQAG